jgi:hypothetical protein
MLVAVLRAYVCNSVMRNNCHTCSRTCLSVLALLSSSIWPQAVEIENAPGSNDLITSQDIVAVLHRSAIARAYVKESKCDKLLEPLRETSVDITSL